MSNAFLIKTPHFDEKTFTASFSYEGPDHITFTETVQFVKTDSIIHRELLDRTLFLASIFVGTSYYKSHPVRKIIFEDPTIKLTHDQAQFFTTVYQEGLSQFAFENHLTRKDLAIFTTSEDAPEPQPVNNLTDFSGTLSLQSGGKDSLLVSELLSSTPHSFWYLSSSVFHPAVLDHLNAPLQHATRRLDLTNLQKSNGLNGHVPITYIVESLALIQAILNHQNTVCAAIGHEGAEPHTFIDDLPVNHQWSKTAQAEKLLQDYVKTYISDSFTIGSPIRQYSELKIAQLFVKHCWEKYHDQFSSCNVANYGQGNNNQKLSWCGNCAKCANSYLLFAPFVTRSELDRLFGGQSLFENPQLFDDFKGLLGIDRHMKPFECVGEIAELRKAYHLKSSEYPELPFEVPDSDFDLEKLY